MTSTATPRKAVLMSLPHSGMNVRQYFGLHYQGALFPLTAGAILYGWRGLAVVILVLLGALIGFAIWRKIGARGPQLESSHVIWFALMLGLMLPPHLATAQPDTFGEIPWPLPLAAGLTLTIFLWLLGGLGAGRIHPVLITYLLLAALFVDLLVPQWVLARNRLLLGDVLNGRIRDAWVVNKEPWLSRRALGTMESESVAPASESLTRYTTGREKPPRGWLSLQSLLRDNLPPLEDLIVGGHPGPFGTSSAIAVIIGGLLLLYRGLIDFRIPLIIVITQFFALLILPIPLAVSDHTLWHWMAFRGSKVGWATGITFANYELMASPTLFMAFFLATAGPVRPMARRARIIYAGVIGVACAALQLYMNVATAPYLALLLASLLTPAMDRWFSPRPLV